VPKKVNTGKRGEKAKKIDVEAPFTKNHPDVSLKVKKEKKKKKGESRTVKKNMRPQSHVRTKHRRGGGGA